MTRSIPSTTIPNSFAMASFEHTSTCGFDKLLSKNIPHIFERIFFSLDYKSFKACSEINKSLKELLTSRYFRKRARSVFSTEVLEDENELMRASKEGNLKDVERLLYSGMVDVNCVGGKYQATPLCEAAYYGNERVLQMLMDHGADQGIADKHGQTPLHRAAERGHTDALLLLMERGALPDGADKYGQTPLHGAALNGHLEVVKLLLDRGADRDRASSWGGTPLYYASMHGHRDAVRELLRRGSDANAQTESDGSTPLHVAARRHFKGVVQVLIEGGADSAKVDLDGKTPLHWAERGGHSEVISLMRSMSGQVPCQSDRGHMDLCVPWMIWR